MDIKQCANIAVKIMREDVSPEELLDFNHYVMEHKERVGYEPLPMDFVVKRRDMIRDLTKHTPAVLAERDMLDSCFNEFKGTPKDKRNKNSHYWFKSKGMPKPAPVKVPQDKRVPAKKPLPLHVALSQKVPIPQPVVRPVKVPIPRPSPPDMDDLDILARHPSFLAYS
jgi:hypothetical protein